MGVTISGLTGIASVKEADVFELEQDGISKKVTKTQLRSLLLSDPEFATALPQDGDVISYNGSDFISGASPRWRVVPTAAYTTSLVLSSSQISFSGAAPSSGINRKGGDYFEVGSPVKTVISGVAYYGICTAISNTVLTIAGAPLPTGTAITSLSVGKQDMIVQVPMFVGKSDYSASVGDLTAATMRWRGRTGYLVMFSGTHETTGRPKINIKCNGNLVSTNDSNNGIQLSATPGTFTDNSAVAISASNYAIADSQNVVIRITSAVASQNNLSMTLVFVVP